MLKELPSEAETASVIAQRAKLSERYTQASRSTAYLGLFARAHACGQLLPKLECSCSRMQEILAVLVCGKVVDLSHEDEAQPRYLRPQERV